MPLFERFVIGVDIQGFSTRSARLQRRLQRALVEMLDESAAAVDLDRSLWERREEGDGEIAVLPPEVDLIAVVRRFVHALDERLTDHNEDFGADARMRLRVAMHSGALSEGELGYTGQTLVVLGRLLDSPPVRDALKRDPAVNLAQIISGSLFERAVVPELGGMRPRQFENVRVHLPEKAFDQAAYLYVPGRQAPVPVPEKRRREEPPAVQAESLLSLPFPLPKPQEPQPRKATPTPEPVPQLSLEAHVQVTGVRDALAAGQVELADMATTTALLNTAGRAEYGWLRADDGEKLSQALLTELDRAWAEASNGLWGFSAQRECLTEYGLADVKNFLRVSILLGWRTTTGEALRPYPDFVRQRDRSKPFFPTLRDPELEQHPDWHTKWSATVQAVHARLRQWE